MDENLRLLLVKISNADKAAFEEFFKMYHTRMIRFSMLFVNRYYDAEDVVSDVLIKLLKQRHKLPTIENFNGYLFRAVKNQSINFLNKEARRSVVDLEDIPKDLLTDNYIEPHDKVITSELREVVSSSIAKLPPKRKMVYLMIKDEYLQIKQVATLLEISEKTVKKHLELAMKDIRSVVELYYLEKRSRTPVISLKTINLGMFL